MMGKHTYQYEVDGIDDRFDFEDSGSVDWETGRAWVAEASAEDFFHNHDGWECCWPMVFTLYEGQTLFGKYSIDVVSQPHFYSTLVTA